MVLPTKDTYLAPFSPAFSWLILAPACNTTASVLSSLLDVIGLLPNGVAIYFPLSLILQILRLYYSSFASVQINGKKKKKALDFQILADGNTSVTTKTIEPKSLISKVLLSTLKNISSPPFLCALLSKKSLKTML